MIFQNHGPRPKFTLLDDFFRYLDEFLKPPQLPPEEDEAPPQPTKAPERKEKKSIAGAVSPMGGGESKRNQPKAIRNKRLSKAEQKKRVCYIFE